MDQDERRIIDELFAKLHEVEAQSGPRDVTAEALIRRHLDGQPAAPYYMAQAIVAQQEALARAGERIRELERQIRERPAGGFLSGLFGGGDSATRPASPPTVRPASRIPQAGRMTAHHDAPAGAETAARAGGAWSRPHAAGGSFLGGAMQTALGVAGGFLIADALTDLISADPAATAEADAEPAPAADAAATEEDFGAQDDLGDFADMDFGGEEF